MTELEKKLKEFDALLGKTDAASEQRKQEVASWLQAHRHEEGAQAALDAFMHRKFDELERDVASIKAQVEAQSELLPLGYIAREYFHKSKSWLSQRINGTPVRGHVYTLSAEQKQIFNAACQDIGQRIGSFCLS